MRTSNKCRSLDTYICRFLIMCIPSIMYGKKPLFLFITLLSSSLIQVKIQLNHTATVIIVRQNHTLSLTKLHIFTDTSL